MLAQPYIQTLFSFSVASPGAGGGMEVGLRDIKIRCVTFTSLHGTYFYHKKTLNDNEFVKRFLKLSN